MRYFKFAVLGVAALFLAAHAAAQQTSVTTSPGVPPDFTESAKQRVNYYRAMANLPPIVEDAAISAGALNHARYLVKNGIAGGDIILDNGQLRSQAPQDAYRWEDKGRPFFTDDGAAAGRYATVLTARDQLERRRLRGSLDDDAVQGTDSDGAAVLGRRTRRILRAGPVRNRDPVPLRPGED